MLDNLNRKLISTAAAAVSALGVITTILPSTANAATPPSGLEGQKSRQEWKEEFKRFLIETKEQAVEYLEKRRETLKSIQAIIRSNETTIELMKGIRNRSRSETNKIEFDKTISEYERRTEALKKAAKELNESNQDLEKFIKEEMK